MTQPGLVLYKFAVAAVFTGALSCQPGIARFRLESRVRPRRWAPPPVTCTCGCSPYIREQSVQILSTFILPFLVYIGAEALHSSSVLAVVASGLTIGWQAPTHFRAPGFRLAGGAVWRMTAFVPERPGLSADRPAHAGLVSKSGGLQPLAAGPIGSRRFRCRRLSRA